MTHNTHVTDVYTKARKDNQWTSTSITGLLRVINKNIFARLQNTVERCVEARGQTKTKFAAWTTTHSERRVQWKD